MRLQRVSNALSGGRAEFMALGYEEAVAQVTAPGQIFEVVEEELDGVAYRVFKNAPPNLGMLFAATRDSDDEFLVYEDERWTFRQAMEHVDALAHAMVHTYGIKKGDRIGIAMRNLPEWIITFAAAVSIGAISVSLNAWWTEEELDYAIGDSSPSLLVVDEERMGRVRAAAMERDIAMIVVRSDELEPLIGSIARYEDVVEVGNAPSRRIWRHGIGLPPPRLHERDLGLCHGSSIALRRGSPQ